MQDNDLRRRAEGAYAEFRMRLEDGQAAELEELCVRHPELATLLRELDRDFGAALQLLPGSGVEEAEPEHGQEGLARRLLERLAGRDRTLGRYRIDGHLDEGGQGEILRVWDEDLDRRLAMKRMHAKRSITDEGVVSPVSRALGRFLEEAKITGQLDHPGICPVHELGLDEEGRVYFTMKLVEGESLKRIIERVHGDDPEWTRTRVLGVLLRVCEAAGYAHRKGVLHRDIKPSNVMVGRFGEVYLMDWGLAKIVGGREPGERPPSSEVLSVREGDGSSTGSPLLTGDGDVVGTPSYMSPEQARGDLDSLSPASDVYSVGAILYQLLTGAVPYLESGSRPSNLEVLDAVQSGPPAPIGDLTRSVPGELVSICDKAMARRPRDRYDDLAALAVDLRAYLENRVVGAHATGAVTELKKWVRRNRSTALAGAAAVLVAVSAAIAISFVERDRREQAERDRDRVLAAALVESEPALGPVHPDSLPAMQEWFTSAQTLVSKLPSYRAELELLEAELAASEREELPASASRRRDENALQFLLYQAEFWRELVDQRRVVLAGVDDPERRAELEDEIATLEGEQSFLAHRRAVLEGRLARYRRFAYSEPELDERFARAHGIVADLEDLAHPELGRLAAVRAAIEQARGLEHRSLGEYAGRWEEARRSIADTEACPLYAGLDLAPQLGLVPLRRNEAGLWEFWHVLSGEEPAPLEDGYELTDATGLVFVLVPGGEHLVGAQAEDPAAPGYVPPGLYNLGRFVDNESPVRGVQLDPYLLSKYELTQGQWIRLTGENPSRFFAGSNWIGLPMLTRLNPVEHVSWDEAVAALAHWNLTLPTEAQWEAAARAGSDAPFWWGDRPEHAPKYANGFDATAARFSQRTMGPVVGDDGWPYHAPVDRFPANPWGFHSVLGNVEEWCLDWFEYRCESAWVRSGTGELLPSFATERAYRGGSWSTAVHELRAARRLARKPTESAQDIGIRPAIALVP